MPQFSPNPTRSISAEMIRQGYIPTAEEALEICHWDEAASGTDTAIALGSAAVGVGSASGILALSGFTLPILIPLVALGYGAITAWNARVTQRYRQSESDFLQEYGNLLAAAEQKLNQGQPASRVAAALDAALRAYNSGDVPQLALPVASQQPPASSAPTAMSGDWAGGTFQLKVDPSIGVQTQLGAIAVEAAPAEEPLDADLEPIEDAAEVSPDARRDLIARLRAECPALLKLVKSHPIRAVGVQRSGKTTLVKRLALLRMVLIPGHRVIAATPHHETGNPYPAKAFKVVGIKKGERDYPAIEREWDAMTKRVQACTESSITTIWDEFGLFDQVMPTPPKTESKIKTTLTSCLRETMKFGEHPIFIVHGETAAFLPGAQGLVTVFLGSTVRVETIGEAVEDEMGLETIKPTGRFTVEWLDGSEDEGQIPAWLTEKYLLGLIGKTAPTAAKTATPVPETTAEPDHHNRTQRPKLEPTPAMPTAKSGETGAVAIAQQIMAYIEDYPPGEGGVKMRKLKERFRKQNPKDVEKFAFRLAKQLPDRFRIYTETINGGESLKIEALTNTKQTQ